ncbi:MAG TPA: 3-hydroxyacyl-[acyl-carrier-protein] dehydratase FabZ [Clostridiales bacterium]|nr:3-hydroxyacyl-[acyl-carrier-protein] dehydratase FabZ [Clostridiales bacterium]
MAILGIDEIKEILPHSEPFLMIDRIDKLEVGKSATARKAVSVNEWYFMGHFKNTKIMPGVLILEAVAQTGAIALMTMEGMKGKLAYLGKVKNAKFMRKVVPGDVLILEANIENIVKNIGTGKGRATVDGELAVECSFMFAISE